MDVTAFVLICLVLFMLVYSVAFVRRALKGERWGWCFFWDCLCDCLWWCSDD